MKRGSLFLTAFISAAACFASLMFFVGPQKSGWNRYGHGCHTGFHHHYHNGYINHSYGNDSLH